jgi:hypothetical protein
VFGESQWSGRWHAPLSVVIALMVARSAAADCTKDTDCKGDRICERGVCVSPTPPPPPASTHPLPAPLSVLDGGEVPAAAPDAGMPVPEVAPPPVDAGPPVAAPIPLVSPPAEDAGSPPAPLAAAGPRSWLDQTYPTLEVRLEGFYGFDSAVSGGGAMAGVHLGATTWLGASNFALYYMGGAELGVLVSQGVASAPASLSLELGAALLADGDRRTGTSVSLCWAPRLLNNFSGGEVASLVGVELALHDGHFKVPLWALWTRDQTLLLGLGLGYGF